MNSDKDYTYEYGYTYIQYSLKSTGTSLIGEAIRGREVESIQSHMSDDDITAFRHGLIQGRKDLMNEG